MHTSKGESMSSSDVPQQSTKWPIIILTVLTALIHFSRAAADPEIRILFALNGLGYLILVAAFYLPQLQGLNRRIRWVFIGYTLLTIILYFVWAGAAGEWVAPMGPIDKVIEITLVILLWRS
jgi:hypothetical protein